MLVFNWFSFTTRLVIEFTSNVSTSASAHTAKELVPNTLTKVFGFKRDSSSEGRVGIRLKKLSIISQDPGHCFGNPAYFYDVCDDQEKDDERAIVTSDAPVETQICLELLRNQNAATTYKSQTLLPLTNRKHW
jgi:hypothetical protein